MKFMSARATTAVAAVLAGAVAAGCSSAAGSATTTGDVSAMPIIHGLETGSLTIQAFPAIDSGGLLIATSQGLLTDRQARKRSVGGEVLAFVW